MTINVRDALDDMLYIHLRMVARKVGADTTGTRATLANRIFKMFRGDYTMEVMDALTEVLRDHDPRVGGKRRRVAKKRPARNLATKFDAVADTPVTRTPAASAPDAAIHDAAIDIGDDDDDDGQGGVPSTPAPSPASGVVAAAAEAAGAAGAAAAAGAGMAVPVPASTAASNVVIVDGSPPMIYVPSRLRFWASPA